METPASAPSQTILPARRRRAWRIARNIVLAVIALIVAIWLVLYITTVSYTHLTLPTKA